MKKFGKKETDRSLEELVLGQWRSLYLGGALCDNQSDSKTKECVHCHAVTKIHSVDKVKTL